MGRQHLLELQSACGSLLNELQLIWDELGENNEERDHMLLQLQHECLEVHRRKVDQANRLRAQLHHTLADIHSDIVALASTLGDRLPVGQLERRGSSLKEQVAQLKSLLENLTLRKGERLRQFLDVKAQIERLHSEIFGSSQITEGVTVNEDDLTLRKLDELQAQRQTLQKEKNDRLYKVLEHVNTVHDLCAVLGLDFFETIREVHPSLDESLSTQAKSISNETLHRIASTVQSLRDEKKTRMQKIQDLGASLIELWNLMDTTAEEQNQFQHVTCNIAAAEHEVVAPGALAHDVIEQAEAEVRRLDQLKVSKTKELVLKKCTELEEICRKAHITLDGTTTQDKTIASIESGMVDAAELLARVDRQIGSVKEEAFSRKDILEKIGKWMTICDEESWLEDYNKDENRYNATRGAHLNMKRAERARAAISKIPALVDSLITKTRLWEEERDKPFLYDGARLLSTLEEYMKIRMEKEEERRRHRDRRRLQDQTMNEQQQTLLGTRISRTPTKKGSRLHASNNAASRAMNHPTEKINGMITPMRNATVGATQNKITSSNMPEDDDDAFPAPHDSGALILSGARQPLSPVPAPSIRPNRIVEDVECNGQFACMPMKAVVTMLKSPSCVLPSAGPLPPAVMDEENATPKKQTDPQHQQIATLHEQQSSPQVLDEYSFEERRLAFIFHPESKTNTWTDCR